MTSLADRLQQLQLCLESDEDPEVGYRWALRDAIVRMDLATEMEVLKSLGDLHLQRGRVSKSPAEFERAAGLYVAVLKQGTDPDMGQTLVHRLQYTEKLSNQDYTPKIQSLLSDGKQSQTDNDSILRVATTFNNLDADVANSGARLTKEKYTKTLVTAIATEDKLLAEESLKSLGDWYLEEAKRRCDVAQLGKATAMYNKALTTCEEQQQQQTLQHRVAFTERVREAVARRSAQTKGPKEDRGWTDITPSVQVDNNIEESWEPEFTDHMRKGNMSLQKAELDTSEKHFAAALKLLHRKAQQYQREVEPLCKLGDVYSKRGQQTGDGGDFVKAAALYNAAMARSKDEDMKAILEIACKEIERSFLKEVIGTDKCLGHDGTAKHKKQLKEMRDQIKLEMETIDQQLDPYVHDEDDPCVKEIEAKRAQAVRQLFEKISQERIRFISMLVKECILVMGPPPCKYALIGLGSQATGLVTPYSDLEFAILVEEESEENLIYFKQLTHYLHLKVVNLGETILPALGIKSLNDFYSENPNDNWYYDSVTPRGFAFDGSMPKASKTPLGRQGTSELIRTPTNMAILIHTDVTHYLDKGYHLASILRNPCLMVGDQDLVDEYAGIVVGLLKADGGKMAMLEANDTLRENMGRYEKHQLTAMLTDVKKEIYRFPSMIVEVIALSAGIVPTCFTIWQTIAEMERRSVINSMNAHHLRVLVSISAELRLRTYIANGGQKENMSALSFLETSQGVDIGESNMMEKVFYVSSQKQLFRYYYTAIPLQQEVSQQISDGQNAPIRILSNLFENNGIVQGMMHYKLCDYVKANHLLEKGLLMLKATHSQETGYPTVVAESLNLQGSISQQLGDYKEAISCHEKSLKMFRKIHHSPHSVIASSLNSLGLDWFHLGDHEKAVSYHQQALQMKRCIYGEVHPEIAISLDHLALAMQGQGHNRETMISYQEQALEMRRSIYGRDTAHPDIAASLNNLGASWNSLGDPQKAISFFEQVLQMFKGIYGRSTAHPHIATALGNQGTLFQNIGDHKKALQYNEQALGVLKHIHGQNAQHPEIATVLNSLGRAYYSLDNFEKAIKYHEEALQMKRRIYGQKPHPNIASSLTNLGNCWFRRRDYEKAISYYGKALEMVRETGPQRHVLLSMNNLGCCWDTIGDHKKAISYLEKALKIGERCYGRRASNPDIALSLNSLAEAWYSLGNHRKSLEYQEQALQMYRAIYGQDAAHPTISTVLYNLGSTWEELRDYRKAKSFYQEALDMANQLYQSENRHHHTILNPSRSLELLKRKRSQ